MKIATWNVRGFGTDNNKSMVKGIVKEEKLDLIGLTETKHCEVSEWDMRKCWGNHDVEWMHVAAKQNSGGLILSWKCDAFIQCNSFAMPRWLCVLGVPQEIQVTCVFCLVYAPSTHLKRMEVWDQLRLVKLRFDLPWILMGDFNKVMCPEERRGASEMTQGMRELQNLVYDMQLTDMEIRQKYT